LRLFAVNKNLVLFIAAAIILGSLGVGYACFSQGTAYSSGCYFVWAVSNDDGAESRPPGYSQAIDHGDNGADPDAAQAPFLTGTRWNGNYAQTTASLNGDGDKITVTLNDIYPGYLSTLFFGIANYYSSGGFIDSIEVFHPDEITAEISGLRAGDALQPGGGNTAIGALAVGLPADSGNQTQGQSYSLTVSIGLKQAVTIKTTRLAEGATGLSYSAWLTAEGGASSYAWTYSGRLPDGLTLNSSGLISGIPSAAGWFTFTATARDSLGFTSSQTLTISILAAPIVTVSSLKTAEVGVYYRADLNDGSQQHWQSWCVISGSLPPGLRLDSESGRLYGTPSAAGIFTFKVKTSQGGNHYTVENCTLEVAPAVSLITEALPSGNKSLAYTQNLSAGGGRGPYSWELSGGALPDGLKLNASSGVISGTPRKTGRFDFKLTVEDSLGGQATRSFSLRINK
jgi:hypothetical protein